MNKIEPMSMTSAGIIGVLNSGLAGNGQVVITASKFGLSLRIKEQPIFGPVPPEDFHDQLLESLKKAGGK